MATITITKEDWRDRGLPKPQFRVVHSEKPRKTWLGSGGKKEFFAYARHLQERFGGEIIDQTKKPPYIRKTRDELQIQRYGSQYGWEECCSYEPTARKNAIADLKEYRFSEPGAAYRLKKVRVKIEQEAV